MTSYLSDVVRDSCRRRDEDERSLKEEYDILNTRNQIVDLRLPLQGQGLLGLTYFHVTCICVSQNYLNIHSFQQYF